MENKQTQSNVWFTSDTHYFHANVIKYSNRPFSTTAENGDLVLHPLEMNENLIARHNAVVKPQDRVYHLGDFGFASEENLDKVLSRLNGQKYFIYGNHDEKIRKSKQLQSHFVWCRDYHELRVEHNGERIKIVLCHFPMISWNKMHRGSWMLHGHCHGNLRYPFKGRIWDVGVDPNGLAPVGLEDLVNRFNAVKPDFLDHHMED